MSDGSLVPLERGLHLAEGLLSAGLWAVGAAVATGAGALAGTLGAGFGAAMGLGALGLWSVGLAYLAAARRRRAARVLEAVDGHRTWPTLWHPVRVATTRREVEGVAHLWRVHAVAHPDGRMVTAEVGVAAPAGVRFVAWPARRDMPIAARGLAPVLPPPVAGLLVVAPDPEVAREALQSCAEALAEAVPADGSLASYPWGLWWRSTGPPSAERLLSAERGLRSLATARGWPGRS